MKRLSSLVKLDRLLTLDAEAISRLWTTHTAASGKPETFAMAMPAGRAEDIQRTSQKYPSFIIPVDRLTGKEIYYIQATTETTASDSPATDQLHSNFSFNATPLATFRAFGPAAPVAASVTFFMELAESKSLALLAGHFDPAQLNGTQVGQLVEKIIAIWGAERQSHADGNGNGKPQPLYEWLKCFHERPAEFSFSSYLSDSQ